MIPPLGAGKKGLDLGNSVVFSAGDIPPKYKNELDDVMKNVRAIHGENFVDMVKFIMNLDALIGTVLSSSTPRDNIKMPDLSHVISYIGTQLCIAYQQAINLPHEDGEKAINTAKTLHSIIEKYESELNRKRNG